MPTSVKKYERLGSAYVNEFDEIAPPLTGIAMVQSARQLRNTSVEPEEAPEAQSVRRAANTEPVAFFTEAGSAAVAALLHLIKLMGAELVLMQGGDINRFEQAVRNKAGDFASPTTNKQARDTGLAHARQLVEHVLTQIRAQAELKKSLTVARSDVGAGPVAPPPDTPRLLN